MRHKTATAGKRPDEMRFRAPLWALRLPRKILANLVTGPVNLCNLQLLFYRKLTEVWTLWVRGGCTEVTIRRLRAPKNANGAQTSKLSCHDWIYARFAQLARSGAFAGRSPCGARDACCAGRAAECDD